MLTADIQLNHVGVKTRLMCSPLRHDLFLGILVNKGISTPTIGSFLTSRSPDSSTE